MANHERINPGYLQPGTIIGAYKVVDLVGAGGFGFLYRVQRDGKVYALKLSRECFAELTEEDPAHSEERLDREILALKSLRHPNIVKVHCFERWPSLEDGYPYLVMDFIAGAPLYEWRKQARPTLRRICEVLVKIAAAVDYMHRLGLFHRDLKNENILVRTSDGEPILVDFGIARPKASYTVTRAQNTLGTITHYAPEYAAWSGSAAFFKGEPFDWKATTDLHSLGYVSYELLTGRSPFPRVETENEQLHMIMHAVPTAPSVRTNHRVPGSLDKIIMRLLEKDPRARYQTGAELAAALRTALEDADPDWDIPFNVQDSNESHAPTARRRGNATNVQGAASPEPEASSDPPSPQPSAETPALLPLLTNEKPSSPSLPPPVQMSEDRTKTPQPSSTPIAPGGFNPPTAINAKATFTGIGPAPSVSQEAERAPANPFVVPTAIRRQAEALNGSTKKKPNVILLVGGGILALLILFMFIAASTGGGEKTEPQKADLLAEVEKQQKAEIAQANVTPPPTTPEVTKPLDRGAPLLEEPLQNPAPPINAFEAQGPRRAPDPLPTSAPSRRDAADIDAELARQYGGRPTVPAAKPERAAAAPTAPASQPSWLRRSQRLDGTTSTVTANSGSRGVPLGAHLKARLLSNLDSRTIGNAPVEAMLATPYITNGNAVLPARTMIYGRASASNGRFTIEFTRLRLPDNSEVPFTGLAMDAADRKAGLVAARQIQPTEGKHAGVGAKVARGGANTLLGTVGGNIGKDLLRNAGNEVVNQQDEGNVSGGGTAAILLDAPVIFTIFVTAAF